LLIKRVNKKLREIFRHSDKNIKRRINSRVLTINILVKHGGKAFQGADFKHDLNLW